MILLRIGKTCNKTTENSEIGKPVQKWLMSLVATENFGFSRNVGAAFFVNKRILFFH
jgi:hypothetical protein